VVIVVRELDGFVNFAGLEDVVFEMLKGVVVSDVGFTEDPVDEVIVEPVLEFLESEFAFVVVEIELTLGVIVGKSNVSVIKLFPRIGGRVLLVVVVADEYSSVIRLFPRIGGRVLDVLVEDDTVVVAVVVDVEVVEIVVSTPPLSLLVVELVKLVELVEIVELVELLLELLLELPPITHTPPPTSFPSNVTAFSKAKSFPSTFTPRFAVTLAFAIITPLNCVPVPNVAELPTTHTALHPPPSTLALLPVVNALPI
jgi:hypothetical protein